ncbi:hydrogenase maturation nickel metallochaperone HypA [bacterium]|nr:hydrogenase maturation nickel metallochaperone HypA [bacterium]
MHELGIAQDLFHVVKQKACAAKLTKIKVIKIKLGVASGIEESFLIHSFVDHLFPGTIAAGARLEIIKEDVSAKCKGCGANVEIQEAPTFACPSCGGVSMEIGSGREVYIYEIEGE